jgi:hypothetical protein
MQRISPPLLSRAFCQPPRPKPKPRARQLT